MAEPTPVNSQITDSVTQTNGEVLGEAPAMAMGTIYQALASSVGMMMANAAQAQQQANIVSQAATAASVAVILGKDAAATMDKK